MGSATIQRPRIANALPDTDDIKEAEAGTSVATRRHHKTRVSPRAGTSIAAHQCQSKFPLLQMYVRHIEWHPGALPNTDDEMEAERNQNEAGTTFAAHRHHGT